MSIFASIKQLFKHSAVYGIGHIVTRSINFLLMPLYTNLFPREEYGAVGILFTYIAILAIFYTYGLDAAFFRFYLIDDRPGDRKKVFSTAFITISCTSVLYTILVLSFSEPLSLALFSADAHALGIDLSLLISLAGGILFFDSLTFLPFLILRAEQKSFTFILLKFINVILLVAGNIVLLGGFDMGVEGVFYANLIASAVTAIILLPIGLRRMGWGYSKSTLKELLSFGLPYLPSTLSVVIMDTIDRPLLEHLADIQTAGLYNAGVKLGMFMSLFVAAFRFAWHPYFLATSKQENAKAIFRKVFTYVMLACLAVFLVLSVYINDIVRLSVGQWSLVGEQYWDSTIVVPVIMLSYVFYAAYVNFLIGIYLEKKTRVLPFITIAGMLGNLAVNFMFIPQFGMMAAGWARLVAYVIMAVSLYFVAKKLYHIEYEWGRLLKLGLVVFVLFVGSQSAAISTSLLYKTGLVIFFPFLLFAVGFFESDEMNTVKRILKRNRKYSEETQ